MVWSTDVVMKNESRGEKSGSFILWTLEVLSAFIRLLLQHLISSARHCWQRLLCHPQHFPQLPGLFEAEERDIYNRVRSEVKTRGLNFSTTLRDYLRFRLEFYGLILLMLYRQFFIPAFHTEVGRQGGGWPRFLASVFLGWYVVWSYVYLWNKISQIFFLLKVESCNNPFSTAICSASLIHSSLRTLSWLHFNFQGCQ